MRMKRVIALLAVAAIGFCLVACSGDESPEVKEYKENAAVVYFTDGSAFDDLLTMAQAEGDTEKAREVGMNIASKMGELREVQTPDSCIEAQTDLLGASTAISKAGACYFQGCEIYISAMVDLDTSSMVNYDRFLKDAKKYQDEAIELVSQAKNELP